MIIVALLSFIAAREYSLRELNNNPPTQVATTPTDPNAPLAKKTQGKETDPYEKEQVKNTLSKSTSQFQECYLDYLKSKPKKESVFTKLDWQIDASGKAFQVGIVTTESESISKCLVQKIETIQFPPPPEGRPFYVAHNFNFKTMEQIEKEQKEREEMEKKFAPKK